MKPIPRIQQTTRTNCLTACLLMMADRPDFVDDKTLWDELDALYKRSANILACANLLGVEAVPVKVAAGHWLETGRIYMVFVPKDGMYHAVLVDCRGFTPVVIDPAEGWDNSCLTVWEANEGRADIELKTALYFPVLRFTGRDWYREA